MTRINCAIPVEDLTDEHLLAEHREIKRLPGCLSKSIKSGSINKVPKKFCLGKGHVIFFVDKGKFTLNRYKELYKECLKRGFNPTDFSSNWDICDDKYMNDYIPSVDDECILKDRIIYRILNSPKKNFRYYGRKITKDEAICILNNKLVNL